MDRVSTPYQDVGRDVSSWFKGNPLSFALPVVGGPLLFAAQCLGVARFDTYQARTVFLASEISDALRALVLLFLPFTIQTVGFVGALIAGHLLRGKATRVRGALWLVLSLLINALGLVFRFGADAGSPGLVLASLGLHLLFAGLAFVMRAEKLFARIMLVVLGVLLLFVPPDPWLFSSTVWLPLERFTLTDDAYVTGYLLSSADGAYLVLVDDSRQTVLIGSDAVKSRTLCYTPAICQDPIEPRPRA